MNSIQNTAGGSYVGPLHTNTGICPHCGHCPHCGQHRPVFAPYWNPVTQPYWPLSGTSVTPNYNLQIGGIPVQQSQNFGIGNSDPA